MAFEIGIIGGSGLYQIPGLEVIEKREVTTPFGPPSGPLTLAKLEGREVVFLPRHGEGHKINPTEINARANIYALKSLGVKWIIAVSAVGSLRENIPPRSLCIPDQIIDRTKSRVHTFFDDIAVHVGFADPFCNVLAGRLAEAAKNVEVQTTVGGTYVCMEGPLFSTRAESDLYRSWGCSIIGMTAIPEAKLAREAEIAYAMLAVATDYDCWYTEEHVDVETIIENLRVSLSKAQEVLKIALPTIEAADYEKSLAANALGSAIITDPKLITPEIKRKYGVLTEKYFA
jgi:5'-methylthioadenosine phosphorylase